MKKFVCAIMVMALAGLSVSCNNQEATPEEITDTAVIVEELPEEEVIEEMSVEIEGEVSEEC